MPHGRNGTPPPIAFASAALALALTVSGAAAQGQPSDQVTALAAGTAIPLFWLDHRRGWHFYEDPEREVEVRPAPSPRALPPSAFVVAVAEPTVQVRQVVVVGRRGRVRNGSSSGSAGDLIGCGRSSRA